MITLFLAILVGTWASPAAPPRAWTDLGTPLGRDVFVRELVATGEVLVARVSPSRGRTEALHLSRDGGTTWRPIGKAAPASEDPGIGHRVAITNTVILHHGPRGLMRSADLGATWKAVADMGAARGQDGWIARVGARFYATQGEGLAASDDEGLSWSTIAPPAGSLGPIVAVAQELLVLVTPADGHAVAMRREGEGWVSIGEHPIVGATDQALVAKTGGIGGATVELAASFDAGRTWGAPTSVPLQVASFFASDARLLVVGDDTKILGAVAPAESYRALPPARDPKSNADDAWCRFERAVVTPAALVVAARCGEAERSTSRLFRWPLG